MVGAPAGALYCLRFSTCTSLDPIHKIEEHPWFWPLSSRSVDMHMCKNVELQAQNKCFHQNSLCFAIYLQTSSELAWISKLFFYFPSRLSLQSLPRLLKTWPSLRRRHFPRHRYFHKAFSLTFPLEVVVHWFGTLFFTWCHCLSYCRGSYHTHPTRPQPHL